mgnify:FL=1
MDETTESVAARYIGNGEFFSGIPAHDLSAAEWADLTLEQRQLCVTSGLYTVTLAQSDEAPSRSPLPSKKK